MTIERPARTAAPAPIGARALQLRLYREIGVAAVAAALDATVAVDTVPTPLRHRHTPAIVEGKPLLMRQGKAA